MEAKFIKPAGSTFFVQNGRITNTYTYTFLNKTNKDQVVSIKVLHPKNAEVTLSGENKIRIKGDKINKGNINISFPEEDIKLSKQDIEIAIFDQNGKMIDSFKTYFEGPFKFQL